MNSYTTAIDEVGRLHQLLGASTANDALVAHVIILDPDLMRNALRNAAMAHNVPDEFFPEYE